ncbi:DUF4267 domain-containing protein [Kribbella sp. NPDC004138]
MRRFTTVLTVLLGIFPLTFGSRFLFDGAGAAAGFGIDPWPTGTAAGYFPVKGIRDIALGLVLLTLFVVLRQRRTTGVIMAVLVIIPITDMIVVFSHGGPAATALGVHGLTAAVMLVDALLLLRERAVTAAPAPQPVHS